MRPARRSGRATRAGATRRRAASGAAVPRAARRARARTAARRPGRATARRGARATPVPRGRRPVTSTTRRARAVARRRATTTVAARRARTRARARATRAAAVARRAARAEALQRARRPAASARRAAATLELALAARVRVVADDVEPAHVDGRLAVAGRPHNVHLASVAEQVRAVELDARLLGVRLVTELDIREAAVVLREKVLGQVHVEDGPELLEHDAQVAVACTLDVVAAHVQRARAVPITCATPGHVALVGAATARGSAGRRA